MDPKLEQYLKDKYGDNYEKSAQAKYDEQKSASNVGGLFAGIGDALGGRQVGSSDEYFQNLNKRAKEDTVGKIDADKKQYMADQDFAAKQAKYDPSSNSSMAFRKAVEANFPNIAKQYGDSWNQVTAEDQESIFKPLQLKETIEGRKEQARILAADRAQARQDRLDSQKDKNDEKLAGLQTPFGLANTPDDAKQLKEAFESKKNFDNKIQQMIDLRKAKGGGATLDREAVARGKQLSKDLLLEYKNMAKLGVLSQSDEAIINAIIPEDPLAYNNLFEAVSGQDPTLARLQSFKSDSDKDFQNRVQTRTRSGVKNAAKPEAPVGDTVRIKDPKGVIRMIPKDQAQAAVNAGGVLVDQIAGQ